MRLGLDQSCGGSESSAGSTSSTYQPRGTAMTQCDTSGRFVAPLFSKARLKWLRKVFSLTAMARRIAALDKPSARWRATIPFCYVSP